MEIKVETEYDYEVFKKYFRFFVFRGKHYTVKKNIFFAFIILVTSICIISLIDVITSERFELYFFVLLIVYLILFFNWIFLYFIRPKLFYKKDKMKDRLYTFVFREDKMLVSSAGSGVSSSSEVDYASLLKAYEIDDFIYLFINPRQAYLVNKTNIDMIAVNNLRNLLKSKFPPDKYIICK